MENTFTNIFLTSDKKKRYISIAIGIISILLSSLLIAKSGIIAALFLSTLPILIFHLIQILKNPVYNLLLTYGISFFIIGLTRYLPLPLGLSIDLMLVLTWVVLFFHSFYRKINFKKIRGELMILATVWFAYIFLQFFNPESVSRVAWFYAMRGVGLYFFIITPLCFLLFNHPKYLQLFFKIWSVFVVFATLNGAKQLLLGVDSYEQRWLNEIGSITHILHGRLRIFSFFTDAGQFGAFEALSGLVFLILALNENKTKIKFYYVFIACLGFYGMFISGTRGAMIVPAVGFFLYFILSKNIKIIVLGTIIAITAFGILKYTYIGQSNYQIARMRTALDPNNASLNVRVENQKKLGIYLASRPFGGGIGSSGNWGQRFSPNTFLANTPTDSWYVMIWAENGIIGLSLHLFVLFYVLGRGMYFVMANRLNKAHSAYITALLSGFIGIMAASYGNGILGQMPIGMIMYVSWAFIFMAHNWNKEKLY